VHSSVSFQFIGFDVAEPDEEMGVGAQAAGERQSSEGSCAPGANGPEPLEMARTAFSIIDESANGDNNNSGDVAGGAGQAGGGGYGSASCLMPLTQFSVAII